MQNLHIIDTFSLCVFAILSHYSDRFIKIMISFWNLHAVPKDNDHEMIKLSVIPMMARWFYKENGFFLLSAFPCSLQYLSIFKKPHYIGTYSCPFQPIHFSPKPLKVLPWFDVIGQSTQDLDVKYRNIICLVRFQYEPVSTCMACQCSLP